MKTLSILFLLLSSVLPALPVLAANDEEVAARKSALELAGAFANDGFKTRDGLWSGTLSDSKRVRIVQVNLFGGNQYWFCFGATPAAKKVKLSLFDEAGQPLETDSYEAESKVAAGFSPKISGPYYVKIEELEGTPSECCLLYCYK